MSIIKYDNVIRGKTAFTIVKMIIEDKLYFLPVTTGFKESIIPVDVKYK